MGIDFFWPEGATPIDPNEAEGLIPTLGTQAELNEFESLNIIEGLLWARRSRRIKKDLLNPATLKLLHKKMFDKTWRWAGTYRVTQKSIGCEAWKIASELKNLTEDTKCWLKFKSYEPQEIATRFHHRLVAIHPFANGNGRFARLATDVLCEGQNWPMSDWGAGNLVEVGGARKAYIRSLQQAHAHDLGPLLNFMWPTATPTSP